MRIYILSLTITIFTVLLSVKSQVKSCSKIFENRTLLVFSENRYLKDADSCIKVNYPLPGTLKLLTFKSPTDNMFYGYVSGNNISGDLVKANYFSFNPSNPYIAGGYFLFGHAVNTTNPAITFGIWNKINNKPGVLLTSVSKSLAEIAEDVANHRETYIQFNKTVKITGDYYMGVILPVNAGDTVALMSNTNGDTKPGTAWEQWADGLWHAYSEAGCWYINISNAIYPSACNVNIQTSIPVNCIDNKQFSIYPNPSKEYVFINTKPNSGNYQINFYNMLGEKLKQQNIDTSISAKIKINLTGLQNGIYYITIENENKKITRKINVIK